MLASLQRQILLEITKNEKRKKEKSSKVNACKGFSKTVCHVKLKSGSVLLQQFTQIRGGLKLTMSFRGIAIHGDVYQPLSSFRLLHQVEANAKLRKHQSLDLVPDPFINSSIIIQRSIEQLRLKRTSADFCIQLPCPKKGQLQQVDQDHAQSVFKFLHGQRLHNLSRLPVSMPDHLHIQSIFSYI